MSELHESQSQEGALREELQQKTGQLSDLESRLSEVGRLEQEREQALERARADVARMADRVQQAERALTDAAHELTGERQRADASVTHLKNSQLNIEKIHAYLLFFYYSSIHS